MKRFSRLLPLFAIVTGVALVMVTSAFKQAPKDKSGDTLYTFQYNPPATNPFSVTNIENVSNWSSTSTSPGCSGNQKACSIEATDDYVDNSGSSPVLKSTIDIQATLTPLTGTARVTSIADPDGSFANQVN